MKKNLPVTQVEIDYSADAVFVTRTDTRGVITYANDSFIKISGFSKDELLGKSHNVVRHPDMPEWAFKSLWDTVKSGLPWRGIVKNRAKNGDHYWVKATVSPIIKDNQLVGYLSLRKKPSRREIQQAETQYRSHAPFGLSLARRFKNLQLQYKLQLLIQPFLLVALIAANLTVSQQIKERMVDSVKQRANGIAMEVIDSANMLMITGNFTDPANRTTLLKKISESGYIQELQLIRSKQVTEQFGPGLTSEQTSDPVVQEAMDHKTPYFAQEERNGVPVFRLVTPYALSSDFHGTNCLSCHTTTEGSVSGASDLIIDMSEDFSALNRLRIEMIVGQLLLQLALFVFIGWVVKQFVVKPAKYIETHLQAMVSGDLSDPVDIDGRDEVGRILCNVQSSKILLGSMIDQITSTSETLKSKSTTLTGIVSRVVNNSESQSSSAMQVASSMEEASIRANDISRHAMDASESASQSSQKTVEGSTQMRESLAASEKAAGAVLESAQSIEKLEDAVNKINGITSVIREVAEQTNLLALNAAIEAARAGEHGRGFAVVADEVRKLAEKTQQSTADIEDRIKDISGITQDAVKNMERASSEVEANMGRMGAGSQILENISQRAQHTVTMAQSIAEAIHEQATSSAEIADNIQRISSLTHENTEASRSAAMAANDLDKTAQELNELTQQFRI
ncbi:MAG: methyl-accepting chemotaxis protein [Nitrosomonadales bacterium]|nr:methyl-accepting chemotaxis protein [Nitrosomonadales bacterium]